MKRTNTRDYSNESSAALAAEQKRPGMTKSHSAAEQKRPGMTKSHSSVKDLMKMFEEDFASPSPASKQIETSQCRDLSVSRPLSRADPKRNRSVASLLDFAIGAKNKGPDESPLSRWSAHSLTRRSNTPFETHLRGHMANAAFDLQPTSSSMHQLKSLAAPPIQPAKKVFSANSAFLQQPFMNLRGAGPVECPNCGSTRGSNANPIDLANKLRAQEVQHIQEKLAGKIEIELLRKENTHLLQERDNLQRKVDEYKKMAQTAIKENTVLREQLPETFMSIEWQGERVLECGGTAAIHDKFMIAHDQGISDDVSIDLASNERHSSFHVGSSQSSSGSIFDTSHSSASLSDVSVGSESSFYTSSPIQSTPVSAVSQRNSLVVELTTKFNSSVISMGNESASLVSFNKPRAAISSKMVQRLNKFEREDSFQGLNSSTHGMPSVRSPLTPIQSKIANRVKVVENVPAKEMQRRLLSELKKKARRTHWQAMRACFGEPVIFHGAVEVKTNKSVKAKPVDFSTFVPPTHASKTCDQRALILEVVERNFIFSEFRATGNARTSDSLAALVNAFEVVAVSSPQVLWPAGDGGENQAFYIVESGAVIIQSENKAATVGPRACFGEQSLLHAETSVFTVSVSGENPETLLLKLDPTAYRGLLQLYSKKSETEKLEALMKVAALRSHIGKSEDDELAKKLISAMSRIEFSKGDTFDTQQEQALYLIESGTVKAESLDDCIGAGGCFGSSILTDMLEGDVIVGRFTATTEGVGYKIDPNLLLGDHFVIESRNRRATCTYQDAPDILKKMKTVDLGGTRNELSVDVHDPIAMYVAQNGTIAIDYSDGRDSEIMKTGDVFGHVQLQEKLTKTGELKLTITSGFTATAVSDEAILGVLPVQSREDIAATMHVVLDGKRSKARKAFEANILLEDLNKVRLLGEGFFGEVWLVEVDKGKIDQGENTFALKSQRKNDDTRGADALRAIRQEIEVMREIDHPGTANLIRTFEDCDSLYLLMGLIPGGELSGRIYQETPSGDLMTGLPEDHACFYTYVIADTLAFIHSKHYIYRDLKPENIMLDSDGYPVIVDFGFAKHVPEGKTYTFCGTPNYVSPEIILNSGHNRSVDLWAMGITLFEMVTGENPFFFEGMDNMTLYDTICREDPYPLKPEDGRSQELIDLVGRLLVKDPDKRIGMHSGGNDEILSHQWFDTIDTFKLCAKSLPAPWSPNPNVPKNESDDTHVKESVDQGTKMDSSKTKAPNDIAIDHIERRVQRRERRKKEKKVKKRAEEKDEKKRKRRGRKEELLLEFAANFALSRPNSASVDSLTNFSCETLVPSAISASSPVENRFMTSPNPSLRRSQHSRQSKKKDPVDALRLSLHRKSSVAKSLDALGI